MVMPDAEEKKECKTPSIFSFYKAKRPEKFSDSVDAYEMPLTEELFEQQLALLSTKKKQSLFENFVVAVAKRRITPNIKSQTGPDGGGDGKVDAETYYVSDDVSDKWFSVENSASGKELYSDDPREKKNVTVGVAEPDYHGAMMLCGKCKTMLAVIEKPKVAEGFVALPIINEAV